MGDEDVGFFKKYVSFKERVEIAIKHNDVQLVQILLGPKYCQLWQLWLVHGIILEKTINISNILNSSLVGNIVVNQMEIIIDEKRKLETVRDNLQNGLTYNQEKKLSSLLLPQKLFDCITDSIAVCKAAFEQELSKSPDYRSYYVPDFAIEAEDSEELNCLMQQISTISTAEKLFFNEQFDYLISKTTDTLQKNFSLAAGDATYCNIAVSSAIDFLENDQTLKANIGSNFYLRDITRTILPFFRIISELISVNCQTLRGVQIKLKEINRYLEMLEGMRLENVKEENNFKEARLKIKNQIFDRLNDGKIIDKQLVRDMYISLLNNYLERAKTNQSNLLFYDVKMNKGDINKVADQIWRDVELVNNDMFADVLHQELEKNNPNFDVICLFIINSTPILSYKCLNHESNVHLDRVLKKSYQTILIDMNTLIFNFESSPSDNVDVMLLSRLPNQDGTFTLSCHNNQVLCSDTKDSDILCRVRDFAKHIESLIEKGGLNRKRGFFGIPALYYFFQDFFSYFFKRKRSTKEEQKVIHDKISEFYIKLSHSIAVNNEGMVQEYLEDIRERLKTEKNRDVCELYRIILATRWRDILKENLRNETPEDQSFNHFMKILDKKIKAFKVLEIQREAKVALQAANETIEHLKSDRKKTEVLSYLYCILGKMLFSKKLDPDVKKKLMLEDQEEIVNYVACEFLTKDQNLSLDELLEISIDRYIELHT